MIIDSHWREVLKNPDRTTGLIFSDYLEEHGFREAAEAIRDATTITTLFPQDSLDTPIETIFINHGMDPGGIGRLDLHFLGKSGTNLDGIGIDLGNAVNLKMVLVPRGTYWMGGGGGIPGDKHVEIKNDFYIGIYPVTQEQWQTIMGNNPSHFSRDGEGKEELKSIIDSDLQQFPVEQVSWDDARLFIKKLNECEKSRCSYGVGMEWIYRLPTEEWEYACRGAVASKEECSYHYYFDEPTNELFFNQANAYETHSPAYLTMGRYIGPTSKVGMYRSNKLGIYDMHGNVVEWMENTTKNSLYTLCFYRGGSSSFSRITCQASDHGWCRSSVRACDLGLCIVLVPSE